MRSRSGVPQVHKVARRSRLRRFRDQPCHHHSAELGELVGLAQDHKFVGRFLRRIAVARCEEDQNAEQALALEQRPLRFPCLRAGARSDLPIFTSGVGTQASSRVLVSRATPFRV